MKIKIKIIEILRSNPKTSQKKTILYLIFYITPKYELNH